MDDTVAVDWIEYARGGGEQRKKYQKLAIPKNSKKRPKNSTLKPLFTIFMPCLKIQGGGHGPPCPPLPTPINYDEPVWVNTVQNITPGVLELNTLYNQYLNWKAKLQYLTSKNTFNNFTVESHFGYRQQESL